MKTKTKILRLRRRIPTEISVASGKDHHSTVSISSSLKSNETLKKEKEKKKKICHYICQQYSCKKRMKIEAEAYQLVSTDLVVAESKAELDDKELEDEQLA